MNAIPKIKTYGPGETTPLDELLAVDPDVAPADENQHGEATRLTSVVERIEADIGAAQTRLSELLKSRASVVLNGGDLDKLHNGLRDTEQLIATLEAGRAEADDMLAAAREAERARLVEQRFARVKGEHYAAAANTLLAMYDLMAGVCHAAEEFEKHRFAVEEQNMIAARQNRPDLALDMSRLRAAVADTIGTARLDTVVPTRMGESDAAFETRLLAAVDDFARKPLSKSDGHRTGDEKQNRAIIRDCKAMRVERGEEETDDAFVARRWAAVARALNLKQFEGETGAEHRQRTVEALARRLKMVRRGETDAAYQLRVLNAKSAPLLAREASDPLRMVGEKALMAIKHSALGLDALALRQAHQEVRMLPTPAQAPAQPGQRYMPVQLMKLKPV